jgi:serine protease Do
MRRFISFGPAFVVLLTSGAVLLAVPRAMRSMDEARTLERVALARDAIGARDNDILQQINAAVRNIAEAVEPSVVHLDVPLRNWRGSTGSGWVYDSDGHIITNAHVVSDADTVRVQFYDGRVLEGKVIGRDPLSDVAVVRVEPGSFLVPTQRATSERVYRGDRVYAFGSPFGFKFSMSEGIVSGLGRTARAGSGTTVFSNFIQTDAAVNPGNSGGPLVDVQGRVVGMNVAIATAETQRRDNDEGSSAEGQSAGISFAIPLATIESRADQIIAGGPIRTGFIGISFGNWTVPYGQTGFEGLGVQIDAVLDGGGGSKAGLQAGDIITKIDGQEVSDGDVLRAMISAKRPGSIVTLGIFRDNKHESAAVTLGDMPNDARAGLYATMLAEKLGVILAENDAGTLVVARLRDDSPAATAGFSIGQAVSQIADQPVASADDAMLKLNDAGLFIGRGVRVVVRERDGNGQEYTKELILRLGGREIAPR